MGSIAAKQVAQEVIKQVEKGGKHFITTIAPKKGYSIKTAESGKIQQTESYKSVINPFVARLEKHRTKILKAMEGKDLTKEQYKVLSESLTKVTHDVQLLSGGKTENVPQPIIGIQLNVSIDDGNAKDSETS